MEFLGQEDLHRGKHVDFVAKRYRRADGSEIEREVVEHPGSVAVLAHDEEFAYLVAQPREAVEEDELLEIPAGTLDVEGEDELECAKRELAEEAELQAENWTLLHVVYPSPGVLSEKVTIFEATGLSPASGERDDDEEIEIVRLDLAELDRALPEIRDATTVIALLRLKEILAEER
ncbi:MAG TPA: NUDIX hydrolase [Solirubrobacterales bacterium]|jgi:ADP-ribose pyrophosphatase|nr:NUDIX hydrolase [Solirubrobacterales bacterium]